MVQALIALSILFTYPLQFYVPIAVTWPAIQKRFGASNPVAKELGYRALLVLLTCKYPTYILNANVCEDVVCLLLFHAKTTERIGIKFGIEVDYSLE